MDLNIMNSNDMPVVRLLHYIEQSWTQLCRNNSQLLQAAKDPKFPQNGPPWPVYVPEKEDLDKLRKSLQKQMPASDFEQIELLPLPANRKTLTRHGLLYLPCPYVVPGGRFNEQYGWDSFPIVYGLLRDGEIKLATNLVDNFIYEIENYGTLLNANRTYYTSRSQPPFLTSMILAIYYHTRNVPWMKASVSAIEKYYQYWVGEEYQHITPETGLSRYYDLGEGPAPEVLADEKDDQGRTHYERVTAYFRSHSASDYGYDITRFYDVARACLTALFYIADRSMRESGFDPSNRFGQFNVGVIDFNPVCLNVLLYRMECESAEILRILGEHEAAEIWHERSIIRRRRINELMWDGRAGLYFDINARSGIQRKYPFGTTFYPLWAGMASREQARRVVANLPLFEAPGGLQTSTEESGCQWDRPWGWAPLELIAIKGLRRYGYEEEANRLSINFLSLVLQEFVEHNAVFEKYDVVHRSIGSAPDFGYGYNVVGFGWTNSTVLELLADLPRLPRSGVGVGRPID